MKAFPRFGTTYVSRFDYSFGRAVDQQLLMPKTEAVSNSGLGYLWPHYVEMPDAVDEIFSLNLRTR